LLALPPDAPAVEDKLAEGEKEKLQEGSKTISWEEMERLRSEIFLQLK